MSPIPIDLAVEDALSEAVLRQMLERCGQKYAVGSVNSRGGNGYLRKTIHGWNAAAKGKPFLLVTDLDSAFCPPCAYRKLAFGTEAQQPPVSSSGA